MTFHENIFAAYSASEEKNSRPLREKFSMRTVIGRMNVHIVQVIKFM